MATLRETRDTLYRMAKMDEFSEFREVLENGAKFVPYIGKVQGVYQSLRFAVPLCEECQKSCKRSKKFECGEFIEK